MEKERAKEEQYRLLAERSRREVLKMRSSIQEGIDGGYKDLKESLLRRGWVENVNWESTKFDIKWTLNAKDIDYIALKEGQVVNHFGRNREITTKKGLTNNLRHSYSVHNLVDMEHYYPRAYDLSDPQDVGDFILEYKLTKCVSILRGFLEHVNSSEESTLTYGPRIVDAALRVCERQQRDINDVIDSELVSFGHGNISSFEWELLRYVSLDNPMECVDDGSLPKSVLDADIGPPDSDSDDDEDATNGSSSCIRGSAADVTSCARYVVASHYTSKPIGRWTIAEVKRVLTHLYSTTPQCAHIDGLHNAWIEILSKCRCSDETDDSDNISEQWVVQKYIERPLLIKGYKFDIRVWVLVTDWNPLSVWIWQRPYIRFASEKYDPTLQCEDKYIHMVNNSIVKDHPEFHRSKEEIEDSDGFMWFLNDFQRYLHNTYCKNEAHIKPGVECSPRICRDGFDIGSPLDRKPCHVPSVIDEPASTHCEDIWSESLQPQIEEIVVSSLWCVFDNIDHRKGSCELFGYDFMISDTSQGSTDYRSGQFRVWLIEVNSSPAMEYSTKVTEALTKDVMEDTVKVLVDYKDNVSADTGSWKLCYRSTFSIPRPLIQYSKLEIIGTSLRPPKRKVFNLNDIPADSGIRNVRFVDEGRYQHDIHVALSN
ncbi:Tubulin tyrosine ligase-like, member [Perkinsus chesapeaki]|uniref:Tubulin tyrosine ligase-like, member n=1 Tax=Perkinsus chesapeaki TaxID=330153 RepID=A0A7J6N2I3_PERCH|nr:Tubulin tyrosine ligase-like, member [Perkinsus chesapeaki]